MPGDIVGYGPEPEGCVELLHELAATCVAGNHELALLGRLPEERVGDLARSTLRWTRSVLSPDALAFLAALRMSTRVDDVVMAHGSLSDATQYVTSKRAAAEQVRQLASDAPDAQVLVLGHTHRPRSYSELRGARRARGAVPLDGAGRLLLNPGSVGQSRQWEVRPHARSMIVDLARRRVEFFAVDYDVAATLAQLRMLGFPRACVHHPRDPVRAVGRRVARLLARSAAGPPAGASLGREGEVREPEQEAPSGTVGSRRPGEDG